MAPITDGGPDSAKLRPSWLTVLGRILLPVGLLAIALIGGAPNLAKAAAGFPNSLQNKAQVHGWATGCPKGEIDLDSWPVLESGDVPKARWAASTTSGLYVQVTITTTSSEPTLQSLRYAGVAADGSVYYMYE